MFQKLKEFPGFAVKYDAFDNPFFQLIIEENLRKLQEVEVGRTLLARINFTQSGFSRVVLWKEGGEYDVEDMKPSNRDEYNRAGCPFWMDGSSSNSAANISTSNQSSVCFMKFSNVQITTRQGEKADPYIVLAHELIHSLHSLQGTTKNGREEEEWTTGIGKYENDLMTENGFRQVFGLAKRKIY